MKPIKIFVFAMGIVAILWIGSCAMFGVGTIAAIKSIDGSAIVEKAEAARVQSDIDERNDEMNREASRNYDSEPEDE
jgi:hypothetical protein